MAKPRIRVPRTAKVGDIVEIKSMLSHKMESGRRKDKKTGKIGARKKSSILCTSRLTAKMFSKP